MDQYLLIPFLGGMNIHKFHLFWCETHTKPGQGASALREPLRYAGAGWPGSSSWSFGKPRNRCGSKALTQRIISKKISLGILGNKFSEPGPLLSWLAVFVAKKDLDFVCSIFSLGTYEDVVWNQSPVPGGSSLQFRAQVCCLDPLAVVNSSTIHGMNWGLNENGWWLVICYSKPQST